MYYFHIGLNFLCRPAKVVILYIFHCGKQTRATISPMFSERHSFHRWAQSGPFYILTRLLLKIRYISYHNIFIFLNIAYSQAPADVSSGARDLVLTLSILSRYGIKSVLRPIPANICCFENAICIIRLLYIFTCTSD